jgi:hypothetical protein
MAAAMLKNLNFHAHGAATPNRRLDSQATATNVAANAVKSFLRPVTAILRARA